MTESAPKEASGTSFKSLLLRQVVPPVLVGLVGALGGFLTADSLAERSRAKVYENVLDKYFSTDNWMPGKRDQLLTFIEMTFAEDDPRLRAWIATERERVEAAARVVEDELRSGPTASEASAIAVPVTPAVDAVATSQAPVEPSKPAADFPKPPPQPPPPEHQLMRPIVNHNAADELH